MEQGKRWGERGSFKPFLPLYCHGECEIAGKWKWWTWSIDKDIVVKLQMQYFFFFPTGCRLKFLTSVQLSDKIILKSNNRKRDFRCGGEWRRKDCSACYSLIVDVLLWRNISGPWMLNYWLWVSLHVDNWETSCIKQKKKTLMQNHVGFLAISEKFSQASHQLSKSLSTFCLFL